MPCPCPERRAPADGADPASPALQRRFQRGIDFEAEVMTQLQRFHPDAQRIEPGEAAARETATLAAMQAGVSVILAGRLPGDAVGRRVGEPDVLVAAAEGGYRAVDVKHHRAFSRPLPAAAERRGQICRR